MPSWKKVITSGSDANLNSLNVISGITGSLQGTASYAETLDGLDSTNFVQTSTAQTITGNKSFRDTTFFGTDSADGKTTFVEQTAGLSASISIDSEANLIIQNAEDLTLVTIYQNGDGISLASGTFTGNLTGNADTATTASFASTASFVNTLNQNLTLVGNQTITGSLTVTNNLIVLGSSSLQYMSQSTLNIGTNLITVNTFNPSVRFGGLAVIDSGSSPQVSGSFLYDSFHDEFIFVHRGDGTNVTSSHFLVGPQTYNDLGNETYIAANTILKSQGNEHVIASTITDNGSLVNINSNLTITGSASNSLLVKGSGTTSATNALRIENSNASASLTVRDDGLVSVMPNNANITIDGSTSSGGRIIIQSPSSNALIGINSYNTFLYPTKLVLFARSTIEGSTNALGDLRFYNLTTGKTYMFMTETGLTSINKGTVTPNAELDVSGSVIITGSFTVLSGSAIELQVTGTGVKLGNAITDRHDVTGSFNVNGSSSFNGNVTISGSSSPGLLVRGAAASTIATFQGSDGAYRAFFGNTQHVMNVTSGGTFSIRPNEGTTNNPGFDFVVFPFGSGSPIMRLCSRYTIGTAVNNAQTGLQFANLDNIGGNFRYSFLATGTSVNATSGTGGGIQYIDTFAAGAGSANYRPLSLTYTINNSGAQTGNTTGIFLNATQTNLNGMAHNLIDLQVGGSSRFRVNNAGDTIITGSLIVAPSSNVELQVTSTGVRLGNAITDTHNVTGSLNITGSVSSAGIVSIGRTTTSQAVIQRAQTPAGSYSTIFAAGTGIVDTFPYTQLDTHGATIDMRAGDPTSDQYAGGILITANGNTSPLGEGNAIVFKNRTGVSTYTERMRITYDGNVGINVSPSAKLHIDGTVRIDNQNSSTPTGPNVSVGTVSNYWGTADGIFLSTPNTWLKINLGGADYYLPAYT